MTDMSRDDSRTPERRDMFIAASFPMRNADTIVKLLETEPDDSTDDGRSEWRWLRLADGDLMVGFWPQGDTYMDLEVEVEADYAAAAESDQISEHKARVE